MKWKGKKKSLKTTMSFRKEDLGGYTGGWHTNPVGACPNPRDEKGTDSRSLYEAVLNIAASRRGAMRCLNLDCPSNARADLEQPSRVGSAAPSSKEGSDG
jgi:hypothetical protein